ncbi:hypothetical protein [Streptomyces cavernicola]|uniref:Uncharacterized protein n=1 Tax=Streptomyces cavernicola TaxID=3043613 RepID=A0ABT6S4E0_9ACTN|nr:hypothetical protein [Streptomyces sp. B-S-A6]MDI3402937.1 hypothetical protein [Streptomyces sp. B-S-A6]
MTRVKKASGAALVVLAALFAAVFVAAPAHAYALKVTKQGSDKAVFDKDRHIFDVCDKEKDGRPVYAYFSSNPDKLYYDKDSGCDRRNAPGHWYKLGAMYVCEQIDWMPDACSNGVVLKTQ